MLRAALLVVALLISQRAGRGREGRQKGWRMEGRGEGRGEGRERREREGSEGED